MGLRFSRVDHRPQPRGVRPLPSPPALAPVSTGSAPPGGGSRWWGAPREPSCPQGPMFRLSVWSPGDIPRMVPKPPARRRTVPTRGIIRSCSVPGADVSQNQRVSGDVQSLVFTLKALVRYKYTPRLPQCFVTGFGISRYFEAPGLRGACLGTPRQLHPLLRPHLSQAHCLLAYCAGGEAGPLGPAEPLPTRPWSACQGSSAQL